MSHMEYFPRGDTIYRKISGAHDPLAVLKVNGNVNNVAINTSHTLMAICVQRDNELELDVFAFRRTDTEAGVSLHKTDFFGHKLGCQKQVFLYWNPIAYLDAGLFVLSGINCFCIYCPPSLSKRTNASEKLILEGEYCLEIAANCITTGSTHSPLGALTSYLTSSDGDIYLVRPFVPQLIALTKEQIRTTTKFDSSILSGFRLLNESWCDRRQEKVYVFERDTISSGTTLRFKLPIPLKLRPYPEYFYDDEVYDTKVGSFGLNTDVLIQTTSQFVNFWALPRTSDDELILVSSVKFPEKCERTIIEVNEKSVEIRNQHSERYLITLDPMFKNKPNVINLSDSAHQNPSTSPLTSTSTSPVLSVDTTDVRISQTTKIIDPDFYSKTLGELNSDVVEPVVPNCSIELSGNIRSLDDLYGAATSIQKKSLAMMKLIAKLQAQRAAQKHEAYVQRQALTKIKERKESHTTTQLSNLGRIENVRTRQDDLKKRLNVLRSKFSKLATMQSPAFPEAGADETEFFDKLQKEKSKNISDLEEAISKLDGLTRHVKSLPPWHMLENNEDPITPAEQQELKVLLAEQSKQISDLKLLTI